MKTMRHFILMAILGVMITPLFAQVNKDFNIIWARELRGYPTDAPPNLNVINDGSTSHILINGTPLDTYISDVVSDIPIDCDSLKLGISTVGGDIRNILAITCASPSVTLIASSNKSVNYNWSGSTSGALGDEGEITVSSPQTITLSTLECPSVTTDFVISAVITSPSVSIEEIPIAGGMVLRGHSSSSDTNISYYWTGTNLTNRARGGTIVVEQDGTYTLNAQNDITGCTSSTPATITVGATATFEDVLESDPVAFITPGIEGGSESSVYWYVDGGASSELNMTEGYINIVADTSITIEGVTYKEDSIISSGNHLNISTRLGGLGQAINIGTLGVRAVRFGNGFSTFFASDGSEIADIRIGGIGIRDNIYAAGGTKPSIGTAVIPFNNVWVDTARIDNAGNTSLLITNTTSDQTIYFKEGDGEDSVAYVSDVDTNTAFIKGNTGYVSISGYAFMPVLSDYGNSSYASADGIVFDNGGGSLFVASVTIPDGATVTSVIVYGNDSAETWELRRSDISSATSSQMATASFNSADSSITNATVDNSTYAYYLRTPTALDFEEVIYGARVTFTY